MIYAAVQLPAPQLPACLAYISIMALSVPGPVLGTGHPGGGGGAGAAYTEILSQCDVIGAETHRYTEAGNRTSFMPLE